MHSQLQWANVTCIVMAEEIIHTNIALCADGQDGGKVLGVGPSFLKLNLGIVLYPVCIGEDTTAANDKPTAAGKIGLHLHT
jgi:hypothetical protein